MLEMFTNPMGVAVVGASPSPGKLGHAVLQNVIQYGYKGRIYPINPKADQILGLPAYPSVRDIPGPVDLAVILVPSKKVPGVLEECGQKGILGAVVITAGFREVGREGRQLEQQVVESAHRYGIRLVGPNVLGIIDTVISLNASFAAGMPRRGKIAFMSQSGALCTSILDFALSQGIGFSRFYSIGNKADLNEIDFLRAWMEDPETNETPRAQVDHVHDTAVAYLTRHKLQVFGVLPKDPQLAAPTVAELAEGLRAEILCCPEHTGELVEHVLVGAMSAESALTYFRRQAKKAVITGGDRADIQLAALETSPRYLILTGNLYPSPVVLNRADELGVPVLLAATDTLSAIEVVEGYLGRSRFQQPQKVDRFTTLLNENVNFSRLYQCLGIKAASVQ